MNILYIILLFIGAIFIGIMSGALGSFLIIKLRDAKLKKEARRVISGERKNEYEMDGEKKPVNTFIMRGPNGEQSKINIVSKSTVDKK